MKKYSIKDIEHLHRDWIASTGNVGFFNVWEMESLEETLDFFSAWHMPNGFLFIHSMKTKKVYQIYKSGRIGSPLRHNDCRSKITPSNQVEFKTLLLSGLVSGDIEKQERFDSYI